MFAIAFVIVLAIGKNADAPHLLTGCFVSLALAASTGGGLLRQLAFMIWIATGVIVGMAFTARSSPFRHGSSDSEMAR